MQILTKLIHEKTIKSVFLILTATMIILTLTHSANARTFDVEKARQEEWARYEQYKSDYIKFYGLQAYADKIDEKNLMISFGFYGPEHYYIPPDALQAKYNPPLIGERYHTDNRGYANSLNQPSAIKYYGEKINNKYTGYIPSKLSGIYFDHPQAIITNNQASSSAITGYYFNQPSHSQNFYGFNQYNNFGQASYHARIADPHSTGFYIASFY